MNWTATSLRRLVGRSHASHARTHKLPRRSFGGVKQSRTGPERRPGVIEEFLETEYIAVPVD
jgi:acyl-CoA reductase-like NAD-dependent aldehyde dehydrogenase